MAASPPTRRDPPTPDDAAAGLGAATLAQLVAAGAAVGPQALGAVGRGAAVGAASLPYATASAAAEAIEAALDGFWMQQLAIARDRARARLGEAFPTWTPSTLDRAVAEELAYEEEFRRRSRVRWQRDLPAALGLADPAERRRALRALLDRERRYAEQRYAAIVRRVEARVERERVRDASPLGAYWTMDPRLRTHTPGCAALAGHFWPWSVVDRVHPPVHATCGCRLWSLDQAVARGWMRRDQVPDEADAVRRAQLLARRIEELHGELSEAEIGELMEAAVARGGRYDARYARGTAKGGEFRPRRGGNAGGLAKRLVRKDLRRLLEPPPHASVREDREAVRVGGRTVMVPWSKVWRGTVGGRHYYSPPQSTNVYAEHVPVLRSSGEALLSDLRSKAAELVGGRRKEALDDMRARVAAGQGPLLPGEPADRLGLMPLLGFRRTATNQASAGGRPAVEDHYRDFEGRLATVTRGNAPEGYTDVLGSTLENARTPEARALDRPPRTFEEFKADTAAWGLAMADRHGRALGLTDIGEDPDLSDTSAYRDWDGVVKFGPDARRAVENAAAARAAGRPLTDSEALDMLIAQQTAQHEASHAIDPELEYRMNAPGRRWMEESLAEEVGMREASRHLAETGQADVLQWMADHPDHLQLQGNYRPARQVLAKALDRAGVAPEDREDFLAKLKYDTDPEERLGLLAGMAAKNNDTDEAGELLRLTRELQHPEDAPRSAAWYALPSLPPEAARLSREGPSIGVRTSNGEQRLGAGTEVYANEGRGRVVSLDREDDGSWTATVALEGGGTTFLHGLAEGDDLTEWGATAMPPLDVNGALEGDRVAWVRPDGKETEGTLARVLRRDPFGGWAFEADLADGRRAVVTNTSTRGMRKLGGAGSSPPDGAENSPGRVGMADTGPAHNDLGWFAGSWGKGWLFGNGRLVTWETPQMGSAPEHQDKLYEMDVAGKLPDGFEPGDWTHAVPVIIDPEGGVALGFMTPEDAGDRPSPEQMRQLRAADGSLRRPAASSAIAWPREDSPGRASALPDDAALRAAYGGKRGGLESSVTGISRDGATANVSGEALLDGRKVGDWNVVVSASGGGTDAYFENLWLDEDAQRKGFGTAFLDAMKRQGYGRITLLAEADGARVWARLGFDYNLPEYRNVFDSYGYPVPADEAEFRRQITRFVRHGDPGTSYDAADEATTPQEALRADPRAFDDMTAEGWEGVLAGTPGRPTGDGGATPTGDELPTDGLEHRQGRDYRPMTIAQATAEFPPLPPELADAVDAYGVRGRYALFGADPERQPSFAINAALRGGTAPKGTATLRGETARRASLAMTGTSEPDPSLATEVSLPDVLAGMDRAAEAQRAPRDLVTWRGVDADTYARLRALAPGDSVTDPGFVSTSLLRDDAEEYGYGGGGKLSPGGAILEIRVPQGTPAVWKGEPDSLDEAELVLGRGLEMRVAEQGPDRTVLEVVPPAGVERSPGRNPEVPIGQAQRWLNEPPPGAPRKDSPLTRPLPGEPQPWEQTAEEFAASPATWWHGTQWPTMGEGDPGLVHLGDWYTSFEALRARTAYPGLSFVPKDRRVETPREVWRDKRTGQTGMTFGEGGPAKGYEQFFERVPNPLYREPFMAHPRMVPVRIEGPMADRVRVDTVGDTHRGRMPAESILRGQLKRGATPRLGYFYRNEGEGSYHTTDAEAAALPSNAHLPFAGPSGYLTYPISAVVPSPDWLRSHEDYVREALAAGKPVPARVLADYPQLRREASPGRAGQWWTPGEWGRGAVLPDGTVRTWDERDGTHQQVVGPAAIDSDTFDIRPDGTVRLTKGDPGRAAGPIAAAGLELRWTGKAESPGRAGLRDWSPGEWGKGFVVDGKVVAWATRGQEWRPDHDEAAGKLGLYGTEMLPPGQGWPASARTGEVPEVKLTITPGGFATETGGYLDEERLRVEFPGNAGPTFGTGGGDPSVPGAPVDEADGGAPAWEVERDRRREALSSVVRAHGLKWEPDYWRWWQKRAAPELDRSRMGSPGRALMDAERARLRARPETAEERIGRAAHAERLAPAERAALLAYTDDPGKMTDAQREALRALVGRHPLPEPVVAYRKAAAGELDGLAPGDAIDEEGFRSASLGATYGIGTGDDNGTLRLELPAGTPAYYNPNNDSEHELILPPGLRLRVTAVALDQADQASGAKPRVSATALGPRVASPGRADPLDGWTDPATGATVVRRQTQPWRRNYDVMLGGERVGQLRFTTRPPRGSQRDLMADDEVSLAWISTKAPVRGTGLSDRLVRRAAEGFAAQGYRRMTAEPQNEHAVALNERLGFAGSGKGEPWTLDLAPREASPGRASGPDRWWERGHFGRGLVLRDGRVLTWNEAEGLHNQMLDARDIPRDSELARFSIDTDGSVRLAPQRPHEGEAALVLADAAPELTVTDYSGRPITRQSIAAAALDRAERDLWHARHGRGDLPAAQAAADAARQALPLASPGRAQAGGDAGPTGEIGRAFARSLQGTWTLADGRTLRSKVDSTGRSFWGSGTAAEGTIVDPARGDRVVGAFRRTLRWNNGQLEVTKDQVWVDPAYRRQGLAARMDREMESRWGALGVGRVKISGTAEDGGYVWARLGYTLDYEEYLADTADTPREMLDGTPGFEGLDPTPDNLRRNYLYRVIESNPATFEDPGERERYHELSGIENAPAQPTPERVREVLDMVRAGRLGDVGDVAALPDGRELLWGSDWAGYREIAAPPAREESPGRAGKTLADARTGEPIELTLWHGTTPSAIDAIRRDGFHPGQSGAWGPGVYLAGSPEMADYYARPDTMGPATSTPPPMAVRAKLRSPLVGSIGDLQKQMPGVTADQVPGWLRKRGYDSLVVTYPHSGAEEAVLLDPSAAVPALPPPAHAAVAEPAGMRSLRGLGHPARAPSPRTRRAAP